MSSGQLGPLGGQQDPSFSFQVMQQQQHSDVDLSVSGPSSDIEIGVTSQADIELGVGQGIPECPPENLMNLLEDAILQEAGIDLKNCSPAEREMLLRENGIHVSGHMEREGTKPNDSIVIETYDKKVTEDVYHTAEECDALERQGVPIERTKYNWLGGLNLEFDESGAGPTRRAAERATEHLTGARAGVTGLSKKLEKMTTTKGGGWEEVTHDGKAWKFKMTWEVKLANGQTIKRTVWMKTDVNVPLDMKDPAKYEHSKYEALLKLKATRHTYKAAFNVEGNKAYDQMKNKIEFLRSHNQLDIVLRQPAPSGKSLFNPGAVGGYAIVKFSEKTYDPKNNFEVVWSEQGRKFDHITQKYIKTAHTPSTCPGPDDINLGVKYLHDVSRMKVKDERLQEFEALTQAPREAFLEKFKDYKSSTEASGINYLLITPSAYVKKADKDISESQASFEREIYSLKSGFEEQMTAGMDFKEKIMYAVAKMTGQVKLEDTLEQQVAAFKDKAQEYQNATPDQKALIKEELKAIHQGLQQTHGAVKRLQGHIEQMELRQAQAKELYNEYPDTKKHVNVEKTDKAIAKLKSELEPFEAVAGLEQELQRVGFLLSLPS